MILALLTAGDLFGVTIGALTGVVIGNVLSVLWLIPWLERHRDEWDW